MTLVIGGDVGEILTFDFSLTLLFIMPSQARIDAAVYYFEIKQKSVKAQVIKEAALGHDQ